MAAVLLATLLMIPPNGSSLGPLPSSLSSVSPARPRLLIVTATAGFRHSSIELAEETLASMAASRNVEVVFARTEDEVAVRLTPAELQSVTAVFFVNSTGDLPPSAARALVAWVRDGGTFVGIHSASDTWHGDPEYLDMLGGEFDHHPAEANGEIVVEEGTHPATASLTSPYVVFEEFYAFRRFDPATVRLLLSLRRTPGTPPEPLAWERWWGRGHVLYTALGHREDVWTSEWFGRHLNGILTWALEVRTVPDGKRRAARH
jgi:type 1 glutamine amidotransferase